MRNTLLLFFVAAVTSLSAKESTQAIYALIERITPGYSNQYLLERIPPTELDEDVFEIGTKDNKVLIRGNNNVSLATGFNWYLKYTCKAQISWFGDQLSLPSTLPLPQEEKRIINGKYRVNFNYCTISYTAPWWNWERWEREIDFMAMNAINTPLQTVGLDAVWYQTLREMQFTDQEARRFLVLPAHQAWQWMPNIESVGGGLPLSWIESHKKLAKQIYSRQLELGMQPIQQAFTGYVPKLMKSKYPEAKIATQPEWYGFEGVSQLDPLDPLFRKMGAIFMKNQEQLFGNHGMYAADPFHESSPPEEGEEYLRKVGKVIYGVIKEADPNAKIAMQSWSIRKSIVEQFPKDKLLILCLNGGRDDFWGYDFISGNLHNFGGRINMHGDLALVASNQFAKARIKTPSIVGSGLFMESIIQNPVYYAMAYEMPLHNGAIDPVEWLNKYVERAYGSQSHYARDAWHILLQTAYGNGTNGVESSSIIAARPAVEAKKSGPNAGFSIPYDEQKLYEAQALLLKDVSKLKNSKLYRFDIIDLQRQIMTNLAQRINKRAAEAYRKGELSNFRLHSKRFLELLLDVDEMLASRTEWNFDKWLDDARSWGTNDEEKNRLEKDATELVTYWGFSEGYECKQFDYSWREWSGLIKRYYHQRWKMFYDMLEASLISGKAYKEDAKMNHGREAFRGNDFYNKLADWEISFANTPKKTIHPNPKGNEVELVKKMFAKYSKLNKAYIVNSSHSLNP